MTAARDRGAKSAAAAVAALMAGLSRDEKSGAALSLAFLGLAVLCELEGRPFVAGFLAEAQADYSGAAPPGAAQRRAN